MTHKGRPRARRAALAWLKQSADAGATSREDQRLPRADLAGRNRLEGLARPHPPTQSGEAPWSQTAVRDQRQFDQLEKGSKPGWRSGCSNEAAAGQHGQTPAARCRDPIRAQDTPQPTDYRAQWQRQDVDGRRLPARPPSGLPALTARELPGPCPTPHNTTAEDAGGGPEARSVRPWSTTIAGQMAISAQGVWQCISDGRHEPSLRLVAKWGQAARTCVGRDA
jgi:hypothetical protein